MLSDYQINILNKVCWDYDINGEDVYQILTTRDDSSYPISFETLRYKVLKYIKPKELENIFTKIEITDIFSNINVNKVRNQETKNYILRLKIK